MLQNEFVQYAWAAAPGYELTSWVRDELLVSPEASKLERDLLTSWGWRKKTSVLAPSKQTPRLPRKKPGVVDVEIWAPRYPTQYQMVEAVIADLTHAVGGSPKVSPNHFLVHCGLGSYCPARAPRPLRRPQTALANKMARFDENSETRVVVIDTGYIEKEPLERRRQRGGFDNRLGELWNGEDWVPSPEDDAYLLPDGALDLLDGHGTFTAGQIAERSRKAHITVVGILDEEGAATEAAVARAIYLNADADVILAAFAFPTLHDIEHWVFRGVLPQLKEGSVVVCPAGNGSSVRPHYPAALGWPEYPVVGIGSLVDQSVTDETGTSLSEFSNYGHWVFGYTGGEDVKGLYFDLMAKVEDAEPPDVIWDFNGWASWAGTSFAAPKVAAVLANAAASGTSPREAAEALRAGARRVPLFGQGSAPGLTGYDFRTLAP
ncbi:MAG TPA: S8/S53 family peptidase [Gaiellaceae bacterium]|nr:S8/S53 family peptidase [Gaiellaceae bacterium]